MTEEIIEQEQNKDSHIDSEPQATNVKPDKGNREAAKYRTRLRDAESEVETLKTQLEALRMQQVEQILDSQRQPLKIDALWAAGVKLEDLLNDDGTPNTEKVETAIKDAREKLGIPDLPKGAPIGDIAGMRGEPISLERLSPNWKDVLSRS